VVPLMVAKSGSTSGFEALTRRGAADGRKVLFDQRLRGATDGRKSPDY
jgi:hypothetical protein